MNEEHWDAGLVANCRIFYQPQPANSVHTAKLDQSLKKCLGACGPKYSRIPILVTLDPKTNTISLVSIEEWGSHCFEQRFDGVFEVSLKN